MENGLKTAVALSVIINFVLLGAGYGIYMKGKADGKVEAIAEANKQIEPIIQKAIQQGAKNYEQGLMTQCMKSPENRVVISCGQPTEGQDAN